MVTITRWIMMMIAGFGI